MNTNGTLNGSGRTILPLPPKDNADPLLELLRLAYLQGREGRDTSALDSDHEALTNLLVRLCGQGPLRLAVTANGMRATLTVRGERKLLDCVMLSPDEMDIVKAIGKDTLQAGEIGRRIGAAGGRGRAKTFARLILANLVNRGVLLRKAGEGYYLADVVLANVAGMCETPRQAAAEKEAPKSADKPKEEEEGEPDDVGHLGEKILDCLKRHDRLNAAHIARLVGAHAAAVRQALEQLQDRGHVEDLVPGYRLTDKGRRYLDLLHLDD